MTSPPFNLHPDGTRMALARDTSDQAGTKNDKAVFIFNFFDELRIAPAAKK